MSKGCPKCGCREISVGEIAATGTGLSRLFDIQRHEFKVVTCKNCGYSEFYRKKESALKNIADFFFGG